MNVQICEVINLELIDIFGFYKKPELNVQNTVQVRSRYHFFKIGGYGYGRVWILGNQYGVPYSIKLSTCKIHPSRQSKSAASRKEAQDLHHLSLLYPHSLWMSHTHL